jgi:NPCBM/NEW2 domain
VPKGFTRLLGMAGIEPATRGDGSVRLTINGDERSLLDTELVGNQSPQKLELDIAGVKRLKIVVDYGKNLDTGDWVNLCDLRMVK